MTLVIVSGRAYRTLEQHGSWTRNLPAGETSVGPVHAADGRGGVFNCRSTRVNGRPVSTRKNTVPPRPCAGWNIRGARESTTESVEIPLFHRNRSWMPGGIIHSLLD